MIRHFYREVPRAHLDDRAPDDRARIERLSTASLRTVIEPDTDLPWEQLGDGQLVADELLSTAGLDVELTPEQAARLSREEVASMLSAGVRFEAGLMAGFGAQMTAADVADPRVTYMLHELGEETRHSRAFARLVARARTHRREPARPRVPGAPPQADPPTHGQAARAAERVRARRRGDPRPPPEDRGRPPGHRPARRRAEPVPPPGGGAAPRVRAHDHGRDVGERVLARTSPGAGARAPRHRHALRGDGPPGRVRDHRAPRVPHVARGAAHAAARRHPSRRHARPS